jgi:hypothetical protein
MDKTVKIKLCLFAIGQNYGYGKRSVGMPSVPQRNEQIASRTGQHQRHRFGLVIYSIYLFYLFIFLRVHPVCGLFFLFMPIARSKFYFNFILFFFFTFAALPQISLRPRDDPITVIAGENAQIDCMVADARPAPAITWVLGTEKTIFFLFLLFCFIPFPFRIPGIIIRKKNDTHFP